MDTRGERFGMVAALALTLFSAPGWFYGLFYSASHRNWWMFTLDYVVPPIGVIHGWGAIVGLW
jgi:hypothetical protein